MGDEGLGPIDRIYAFNYLHSGVLSRLLVDLFSDRFWNYRAERELRTRVSDVLLMEDSRDFYVVLIILFLRDVSGIVKVNAIELSMFY